MKRKIGDSTLDVANKLYIKTGLQIKPTFKDIAVNKFNSDIENINFAERQASADKINRWVEHKTNNKIKDLIDSQTINEATKLILINAIYFKGLWQKSFDSTYTSKQQFWASESESHNVDMMFQKEYFPYKKFDDLGFSALKMKYTNSDSSLLVLLPNQKMGIFDLESKLHTFDLRSITSQLVEQKVEVMFPKFKIEFKTFLTDALVHV